MKIYDLPAVTFLTFSMGPEAESMCCATLINPQLLGYLANRKGKQIESPIELFTCCLCGLFVDVCECQDDEFPEYTW